MKSNRSAPKRKFTRAEVDAAARRAIAATKAEQRAWRALEQRLDARIAQRAAEHAVERAAIKRRMDQLMGVNDFAPDAERTAQIDGPTLVLGVRKARSR